MRRDTEFICQGSLHVHCLGIRLIPKFGTLGGEPVYMDKVPSTMRVGSMKK